MMTSPWAVAIFAARETPAVLAATVFAALAACDGRQATIDVLINGNEKLATSFSELANTISLNDSILRVWSIAAPDKAHTWNEYVHRIWDKEALTFFIDGYARVKPNALFAIERRLLESPDAMGASGVPSCGRSARQLREQMLREGGIHGNLYALKTDSMRALRKTGFRLPLGLYRTDPMLAAALAFRLDPGNNQWKQDRVIAVKDATWDVDGISEMTYKNVVGYFKRRLRQAQGELENRAIREHMAIKKLPPHALPETTQDMINYWLVDQPTQARSLFMKRPLCLYAARQLEAPRNWSATRIAPVLLSRHGSEH